MAADSTNQFRLGIALSGGGARGFAHAGALKALEEAGYRPDVIAGVSAGSVAAVLYAAGITPEGILEIFSNRKFSDLCRLHLSGHGLLDMSRFRQLIAQAIAPARNLEDLNIPTYIGVTDFDSGQPHSFSSGPAAERVSASCSIPVIFPPVKIDGVNYVDGGVLRNLPAGIIRDKCSILIGIDCSPQNYMPLRGKSIIDTAFRSFHMLARANTMHDIDICDMMISLKDIADYKVFNLKDINRCFKCGYEAASKALDQICLLDNISKTNQNTSHDQN